MQFTKVSRFSPIGETELSNQSFGNVFCSALAALAILLGPATLQAQNTNTTIQEGRVNVNRTIQVGDRNYNTTYQSGQVNLNRTIQIGASNENTTYQSGKVNFNRTKQVGGQNGNETGQFGRTNRNKTSQVKNTKRKKLKYHALKSDRPSHRRSERAGDYRRPH